MSPAASRWICEVQACGTINASVSATSAGELADSATRRLRGREAATLEATSDIGVRPW